MSGHRFDAVEAALFVGVMLRRHGLELPEGDREAVAVLQRVAPLTEVGALRVLAELRARGRR